MEVENMRNMLRLFVIVGTASVVTTTTYWGIVLAFLPVLQQPNRPRIMQMIALLIMVLTPAGAAAWWLFRRLRTSYSLRIARAIATAFGVFMPVSLAMASPLSRIVGGYSEHVMGHPAFGLVGAFAGTIIITALLSFVPCAFTLWIARRDSRGIGRCE